MPYNKKTGKKVAYTKSNVSKAKKGVGGLTYKKPGTKKVTKVTRKKMMGY